MIDYKLQTFDLHILGTSAKREVKECYPPYDTTKTRHQYGGYCFAEDAIEIIKLLEHELDLACGLILKMEEEKCQTTT